MQNYENTLVNISPKTSPLVDYAALRRCRTATYAAHQSSFACVSSEASALPSIMLTSTELNEFNSNNISGPVIYEAVYRVIKYSTNTIPAYGAMQCTALLLLVLS